MSIRIPLRYLDVQSHPAARSISDDDLCATCTQLHYCPGEQSLCQHAADDADNVWPGKMDSGDTLIECAHYHAIIQADENWVDEAQG